MDDKVTFDPAMLASTDRYKLMIGLVVPRPIGWIGTVGPDGVHNLAPYSYFNVVAGTPPTVLFSGGRRSGRHKDTVTNAIASGEFTANIVTEETATAMNLTSGEYPSDVDEFDLAGLTAARGDVVAAPLVEEATANLECRVVHVVDLGDPPTNAVVFGEVVAIHVRPGVLDGTRVVPSELRAVGRMAGSGYTRTLDGYFEMERPG